MRFIPIGVESRTIRLRVQAVMGSGGEKLSTFLNELPIKEGIKISVITLFEISIVVHVINSMH